eukprot:TRINITY_DN10276_c1_g2_i2.p1 TRINITY_DN10276_c1_g2~~TRINITY_DN10276_c1_g2_i2.p1  ORF type:complete len:432 (+),score=74.86 TRINITY_DN10276_c1_g2_i2:1185-2480(+)
MFVYQTNGDAAKAARVLALVAAGYYFVMTACRQLNSDGETANEIALDNAMDLLLFYHTFMMGFDFLFEDGYWRPAASRAKIIKTHGTHFLFNIAANLDLGIVDEYTMDFIPDEFRMRFVRLLRAPYTLANMMGVEDLTISIIKKAFLQCALIFLCFVVCEDYVAEQLGIDYVDLHFNISPQLLLAVYWALLFVRCLFRRKAVPKGPKKDIKKEEDEQTGDDKDLDVVCQEMIKNVKLLKGVMNEHPEEFMEDILSSLKHETFPPGNKLATIGEVGHHMFFVAKGKVMITTANNKQFTLPSGIALGEIALMRPMSKRTATISAATKCEVFLLNQEAFDKLRSAYPALAQDVRAQVSKFRKDDNALYVSICMKAATSVCYKIGGYVVVAIYVLVRLVALLPLSLTAILLTYRSVRRPSSLRLRQDGIYEAVEP